MSEKTPDSAERPAQPTTLSRRIRGAFEALLRQWAAFGIAPNSTSSPQSSAPASTIGPAARRPASSAHTPSRVFVYIALGGVVMLLAWAGLSEIDQVTRAQGNIVAASRTQYVQSSDGGVITSFHVGEGDNVRQGQLLITLQKERAQAAVADARAKVAALSAALARLEAEVYGKPLQFGEELRDFPEYVRNQTQLYVKRRTAFQEDIRAVEGILALAQAELRINSDLPPGDVSKAEILRLQRIEADIQAQLTSKRNKYFQDSQSEMTKVQEDLNTQKEALKDRLQLLEHTELTAPADGIVNNLRLRTAGAVVRPGDVVLEIFPTGAELIAEGKVSSAEIAFIKVGQPVSVKLDAYDSSIFGGVAGTVSYISPDVLTEESKQGTFSYYRVHVTLLAPELSGPNGQLIRVKSGLSCTLEIKTGQRSVLAYLAKPLIKTVSQSFGER